MKNLYGLIGYPLTHSFSMNFFNEKFLAEDIPAEYTNFEINDVSLFPRIITDYPDLQGLNVTIPYKEKVIPFLDEMDNTAQIIGAVNVIKFIRNRGKIILKGYNSDIVGFTDSIKPLLTQKQKRALILGTGGASKAVWYGLLSLGVEPILVSRTPKTGEIGYDELTPEIIKNHLVIVNTTPLGMHPKVEQCPDIPYDLLTPDHLIYDLIYNPDQTFLMKKAKEKGATVKNGLEMLLLQAFCAWNIWNE